MCRSFKYRVSAARRLSYIGFVIFLAAMFTSAVSAAPSKSDSHSRGLQDPMSTVPFATIHNWNTFVGGEGSEYAVSMATDGSNIYVTGSSQMRWGLPIRKYSGDNDIFVAKLNASGTLLWNTFLGGSGSDTWAHITISGSNIFVIGESTSTWDTPLQPFTGALPNMFIAKIDSNGNLQWNTFLGISNTLKGLYANGIDLDNAGNIYVVGDSDKSWGTPLRAFAGGASDAFVAKFDSSGTFQWNTFLGGKRADEGAGIAVDTAGIIYVAGRSPTTWGNPVRAFQGGMDVFAAKLGSDGNLTWNTFIGGNGSDRVEFNPIAADNNQNVYLVGSSYASWGNPIRKFDRGGNVDAFAAKLDSSGEIQWNTFLGGNSFPDFGNAIAVDSNQNVYLTGNSNVNWGAPIEPYRGRGDAFAAKLNSQGILERNTFFGGGESEYGNAVALNSSGNIYVAGVSDGNWGVPIHPHQGGNDMFVARIKNLSLSLETLSSQDYLDGWVVESGENTKAGGRVDFKTATLHLGDTNFKKQYRSILSFNTEGLPDYSVITSVTLKIKMQSIKNGATFNMFKGLLVDIRKGTFDLPALQITDFQAAASRSGIGPFTAPAVDDWYTLNLTNAGRYINKTVENSGLTQFRLRFQLDDNNNAISNYINFYSGNSTTNKPMLTIQYYVP